MQILVKERRITQDVIDKFSISNREAGWSYPTPRGGTRWKNWNSKGRPKYRWIPEKITGDDLYFEQSIKEVIKRKNGECWYVPGEPDVWAMHSAGIENVFSSFGENNVPKHLDSTLEQWEATRLFAIPDMDDTGDRWAKRINSLLIDTPVQIVFLQLPESLDLKGDVGEAWKTFNSDSSFESWLLSLPRYCPKPNSTFLKNRSAYRHSSSSIPFDYRFMIINHLGIRDFDRNGNSRNNINCPFHDDKNPSATLHKEIGLYCHACGKTFLWIELARILGLPTLRQFLSSENQVNIPLLSTETRESLIRLGCTSIARIYDALYENGILPGYPFTIKNAADLLSDVGIKSNTIYRVTNRNCEKYSQYFPSNPDLKDKEGKNKNQANKPREFALLSPKQIALMVGLSQKINHHYDLMPKEKISSAKEYKAEVYASLVRRKPGFYTRKELCERLNITAKTGRAYDKTANIKVTPREKATKLSRSDIYRLPEKRNGIPGWYYLKAKEKRFAPTKSGAKRAFNHYRDVYLVRQLSNHYSG